MQQTLEVKPRKFVAAEGDEEEKDDPGEADARFQLPLMEPGRQIVLHASLDKVNDEFPLDDQAWLVVGTTRKAKILIVGTPNRVFDAFFDQEGTKKFATSERMKPEDLKTDSYRKKAHSGEFDLVIFDRCAPESEVDMPLANTFFIDRPPPPWQRGTAILKNPLMMPSKQHHPLLRFLTTIWDVRTEQAFLFDVKKNLDPKVAAEAQQLPEGDPRKRSLPNITRIIETSNQAPLVFTIPRGPHTDVVMTFALINDAGELVSDWPLQTSFPLFFRNVLYILGNVDDAKRAVSVTAGEPVVLRPEAGFNFIDITNPAQKTERLRRGDRNEILFSDTELLGVYRYQIGTQEDAKELDPLRRGFAVNLLDANESNIEPRSSIRFGNERVGTGEEMFQPREIWKWILLIAVLLLMVEWLIYHRRIAV
jgi:hypothetical protein